MVKSSDESRKWLHSDALRRAGADLTSLEFLVDSLFVIPNRLMPFNILVKILHGENDRMPPSIMPLRPSRQD